MMRKKTLRIFILLAAGLNFLPEALYSQNISTNGVFPYSKGDIWVYELCESSFCEDEIRFEAIDDSTDNEGGRHITTEFIRTSSVRPSVFTGKKVFSIDTVGNVFVNQWMNMKGPVLIFKDTTDVDETWIAATERNDGFETPLKATKIEIEEPETSMRVIFGDTVNVIRVFYEFEGSLEGKFSDWADGWGIIREIPIEPGLETRIKGVYKSGTLYGDTTRVSVSIDELSTHIPKYAALHQNFPNPFNPSTTISFTLQNPSTVSLVVYDMIGREISKLIDNKLMSTGSHKVQWDANTANSGIYLYRLKTEETEITKSMTLIK